MQYSMSMLLTYLQSSLDLFMPYPNLPLPFFFGNYTYSLNVSILNGDNLITEK